jgi:Ca2+-binding EF-hand superfamily protein
MPAFTNNTRTSETMMRDDRILRPNLICLKTGVAEALSIPVRFDARSGPIPAPRGAFAGISIWVDCSSEYLFIGAPDLPGVWVLSKAEIQSELDRQIKERSASGQKEKKIEDASDRKPELLAKYDANHNGKFDLEEREAAISDPVFLEFELDAIDPNHNGQLDAEELAYFDANENGRLDPPEAAGIRAMQHVLAVRALEEFDQNGNGRLEQQEFWAFTRNKRPSSAAFQAYQLSNSNSEVERLRGYLESATEDQLRETLSHKLPGWHAVGFSYGRRESDPDVLKQEIEVYWMQQARRVFNQ